MGCDVHIASEIRYPGQDWQVWQRRPYDHGYCFDMSCVASRDYSWFGILGGVRGYCKNPIAANRGLPEDVSKEVKECYDDSFHSHTWCTLWELELSIDRLKAESDWGTGDDGDPVDEEPIGPIFSVPGDYRIGIDARPIRLAYDNLCAECDLLDIPKPEIRMIVAFDS